MTWMIGVDTGGTFTDLVAFESVTAELRTAKVPSTPHDPSEAVLDGIGKLGVPSDRIGFFAHGTTVATNAMLEGKGASTGLLITEGMSGVYEGRRSMVLGRQEMLDLHYKKAPLLVAPRHSVQVEERLAANGEAVVPLNEDSVIDAARRFSSLGMKSLAICFLHSFTNPAHEQRARDLIKQHAPGIRVSLSSDVLPVIREYLRLSTTVLDAVVGPVLEAYLRRLDEGLQSRGVKTTQRYLMQSNGGMMTLDNAAARPVQTLLSGPAAGVIAGAALAREMGDENIVTFDMGGTSTDIAIVRNGRIEQSRESAVAGQDVGVRMTEMATIGAGGGTIAHVDRDGLLKVGPQSAGAAPGPVCYGRGGRQPTVTDANLVLGYIEPANFLGGQMYLDVQAASDALDREIGRALGMSAPAVAIGIRRVVENNMEIELRLALLSRGLDPRQFVLIAFGGAASIHAARVAFRVGIERVIVPPYPGLVSAMGLLLTDLRHEHMLTKLGTLYVESMPQMRSTFEGLHKKARDEALQEGLADSSLSFKYELDMRYSKQGYELTVECAGSDLDEGEIEDLKTRFGALHKLTYGHAAEGVEIEIVNYRAIVISPLPRLQLRRDLDGTGAKPSPSGTRNVCFDEESGFTSAPIYRRSSLSAGSVIAGGAIIEEFDSTIVIPPGCSAKVDSMANVVVSNEGRTDA